MDEAFKNFLHAPSDPCISVAKRIFVVELFRLNKGVKLIPPREFCGSQWNWRIFKLDQILSGESMKEAALGTIEDAFFTPFSRFRPEKKALLVNQPSNV